jgi:hypothetical protein
MWGGFLKQKVLQIDGFYQKLFDLVWLYRATLTTLSNCILADADTVLFKSARNFRYCLCRSIPTALATDKNMQMVLRKAHHFN